MQQQLGKRSGKLERSSPTGTKEGKKCLRWGAEALYSPTEAHGGVGSSSAACGQQTEQIWPCNHGATRGEAEDEAWRSCSLREPCRSSPGLELPHLVKSQQLLVIFTCFNMQLLPQECDCLMSEELLSMSVIKQLENNFDCFAYEMASKVSHHFWRLSPRCWAPCLVLSCCALSYFLCYHLHGLSEDTMQSHGTTTSYLLEYAIQDDFSDAFGLDPGWEIKLERCIGKAFMDHNDLLTPFSLFLFLGLPK